jgi:hypothetical protein
MYSTRLIAIAAEMGKIYPALRLNELNAWNVDKDIDARKVFMVPEAGWPGKNEGERKAAAEKAYALDESLNKMLDQQAGLKVEHAEMEGGLQTLDAERRALEWAIREALVTKYSPAVLETAEPTDNALQAEADKVDFPIAAAPVSYEEIPF